MATIKVTKKNILNAIYELIPDGTEIEVDGVTVTVDDIRAYVDTTIEQMNAKQEKAKVRAAAKKAEGDELTAKVEALLTDEYQTGADILAGIEDPEVTKAKVTARLTQIVKAGRAHKATVKTEDGRKLVAYAAGPDPDAGEAEED